MTGLTVGDKLQSLLSQHMYSTHQLEVKDTSCHLTRHLCPCYFGATWVLEFLKRAHLSINRGLCSKVVHWPLALNVIFKQQCIGDVGVWFGVLSLYLSSVPGDSDLPSSQSWSVACQTRAVGGVIKGQESGPPQTPLPMTCTLWSVSPQLWLSQFVV